MRVLVCNCIWALHLLVLHWEWRHLTKLARVTCKVRILVTLRIVQQVVMHISYCSIEWRSIQAVLLLGNAPHPGRRGSLSTTGAWSMLSADLRVTQTAHHHVIVVVIVISEFARCIDSLLHIHILARELFNFPFDCVLHEVLGLSWIHHGLHRHPCICLRGARRRKDERILVCDCIMLLVKCIRPH